MNCKHCDSKDTVKNGCVRERQRYKCKNCGLNLVMDDKRIKAETANKGTPLQAAGYRRS